MIQALVLHPWLNLQEKLKLKKAMDTAAVGVTFPEDIDEPTMN